MGSPGGLQLEIEGRERRVSRVLDLLAGGGYHSEVLSRAVGSDGSVLFHNNLAYRKFITEEVLAARTSDDRLPNVEVFGPELADFNFQPGELDAVIFILGFHDLYYVVDDGSWPIIDQPKLLRALIEGLRHPEDDRLTPVFDESIRRRTDRFILRFRKPR